MRIRKRRTGIFRSLFIMFMFILPIGSAAGVYSSVLNNMMNELKSYSYNAEINTSVFIAPDYGYLYNLALFMDYRYEKYHIPHNFSVNTVFKNGNFTDVLYYYGGYDTPLWTGTAVLGQCYKYLVGKRENNTELMENATRVLRKLITGMKYMLVVPSGGYGPEYPGILGRSAIPKNDSYMYAGAYTPNEYNEHTLFNGTGPYSDWVWLGHTSRDQYAGYIMGLAAILKNIDVPDIRKTAETLALQLYAGVKEYDFLGVDGKGNPTGTDLRGTVFNTAWTLAIMQLVRNIDPWGYEMEYYYYAARSGFMMHEHAGSDMALLDNYYAFNFDHDVLYALLMLETDDVLRSIYIKHYEEDLYAPIRTHRNAYFNVLHILFERTAGKNISTTELSADIADQLMRFKINAGPYRGSGKPAPSWYKKDPAWTKWKEFIYNTTLGGLFLPATQFIDFNEEYYTQPLLADNFPADEEFIWQRNPFIVRRYWTSPYVESSGISFTTVYWIARYLGIIGGPEN